MKRLLPQNWNDTLSLLLIFIIPLLWKYGDLREDVNGALIVTWSLVFQYYFRQRPPKDTE